MASTISTVNQTTVDAKVIPALRYFMQALRTFSVQVDANGRIQDDVMYVPVATDPSAASKTAGTAGTAGGTIAGTAVTLSNFYYTAWDANEAKIAPPLFPNYWADKVAGGVYGLAKQVVDAALNLITGANYGTTVGSDLLIVPAADFGQGDLALLWEYASTKIKQREMTLGLNAAYAGALFGSSSIALAYGGTGAQFMQTGVLPAVLGMPSWCYPGFPSNSENLGGAVIGRGAIAVAVAPQAALMQAGDGDIIERRIITDPESGLSVLYTMTGAGGGNVHGECNLLYGVAKVQDAVVRLASAAI